MKKVATTYRTSRTASIKKSTIRRVEREGKALRAAEKKASGPLQRAADSFVNYAANMGLGTNNITSASGYSLNPVTRQRTLCDWIYRGSWLGGVAVDLVADDMTRSGIEIQSTKRPEDEQKIQQSLVRMRIWAGLNDAIKWSRLYGGSIAVLLIEGQDPSTPLRVETVGKGKFKGLMVLDRWMVDPDLQHLVTDLGPNLGLPEFYRITSDAPAMRGARIHFSRCIRFEGVRLPYWQRVMENLWGLSIFERLYDRMVAFDSATTGAAQLVYKSYIRTYALDGLREAQTAGGDSMVGIANNVEIMRKYQGIEGITLIDAKDEFVPHTSANFSGLSDALVQFAQQLGGALQIPLTRLFGQAPAGLNATGESDIRTYYDGVLQSQENDLRPGINTILRVTARSEGVPLDDSFNFSFVPLWQLSEDEKSQVSDRDTRTTLEVEAAGLVSQQVALQELKNRSKITGRWTNITEEMIAEADDTVQPPDPEAEEGLKEGGSAHPIKAGEKLGEEHEENDDEPEPGDRAAAALKNGKGLAEAMGGKGDDDDNEPTPSGGGGSKNKRPSKDAMSNMVKSIMERALADPGVQASIKEPKIDRNHDVVSGSVASKEGNVTYISSLLPRTAAIGDKTIDPAIPLNVHEQVERHCMRSFKMPYAQAHIVATRAERWAVGLIGVDWTAWEHWIDGELDKIEHGPRANPPPNPHVDPVAAIGHHRRGSKTSDAATRKSTPKYEVVHNQSGVVLLSGVSRTEAENFARQMNKGVVHKYSRVHVVPVRRASDALTPAPYTTVAGLEVVIEFSKGTLRSGIREDGTRWSNTSPADYGYIRRVGSAEGAQEWLDCFVGPDLTSRDVWVIDGKWPDGKFDEHKVVLGAKSSREALGYFRDTYGDTRQVASVTHLQMDSLAFKEWLAEGDKSLPMRKAA